MPRAGKMKECSRRPRETDHVSTTCGEAHGYVALNRAKYGTAQRCVPTCGARALHTHPRKISSSPREAARAAAPRTQGSLCQTFAASIAHPVPEA